MSVQDTSLDAYYGEVKPKLGEKQQRVLNVIRSARRPVCNQEIADWMNQPINTITPRVNELVEKGLVEQAAKEIYPKTNRRVIYWRAVKRNTL